MICALIFDCFGVLYVDPVDELMEAMSSDYQVMVADARRAYERGYSDEAEYLLRLSRATGLTAAELQIHLQSRRIRNDRLLDEIKQLKSKYRIGVLSNVGRGTFEELLGHHKALFDAVILSSEVGMVKPDPEIFWLAAHQLGVLPEECVMIDDAGSNCHGAKLAGMQAILYKNAEQSIFELKKILK